MLISISEISKNFLYNKNDYAHNSKANANKKFEKQKEKRSAYTMSKNKIVVPEAREAMDRFKMEAAAEVGVNLKQGYNGDLTSKQAGSVGGQMVKKMIEQYEQSAK